MNNNNIFISINISNFSEVKSILSKEKFYSVNLIFKTSFHEFEIMLNLHNFYQTDEFVIYGLKSDISDQLDNLITSFYQLQNKISQLLQENNLPIFILTIGFYGKIFKMEEMNEETVKIAGINSHKLAEMCNLYGVQNLVANGLFYSNNNLFREIDSIYMRAENFPVTMYAHTGTF